MNLKKVMVSLMINTLNTKIQVMKIYQSNWNKIFNHKQPVKLTFTL